jgi:hypothetical protein
MRATLADGSTAGTAWMIAPSGMLTTSFHSFHRGKEKGDSCKSKAKNKRLAERPDMRRRQDEMLATPFGV